MNKIELKKNDNKTVQKYMIYMQFTDIYHYKTKTTHRKQNKKTKTPKQTHAYKSAIEIDYIYKRKHTYISYDIMTLE